MNLSEARMAARFARVERGTGNTAYKVTVPGHAGKRYLVLARWERRANHPVMTLECLLDTPLGVVANRCPSGNAHSDTPCYHALAAVMAIARYNHNKVSFVSGEVDARRLRNLGGKVFRYGRRESNTANFAVAFGASQHETMGVAA